MALPNATVSNRLMSRSMPSGGRLPRRQALSLPAVGTLLLLLVVPKAHGGRFTPRGSLLALCRTRVARDEDGVSMPQPGVNPLSDSSPEAWQRLFDEVGLASLLVAIESRMSSELKSRIECEDILQETLVQVWRDREKVEWRGLRAFRSWVLTIVDHRISEAAARHETIKRGGHVRHVSLNVDSDCSRSGAANASGWAVPTALAGTTSPGRMAVYREQAAAMSAALDSLPEELRDVVRLRLFGQQPLTAIAMTLGIGESAVRHRLRKGAELYAGRLRAQLASNASLWATQAATNGMKFTALSSADPSP